MSNLEIERLSDEFSQYEILITCPCGHYFIRIEAQGF